MIKTIIFDLGDVIIPSADESILSNASEILGIEQTNLEAVMKKYIADLQISSISESEFWNKIIEDKGLKQQTESNLNDLFIEPYKKEFFIDQKLVTLIKLLSKAYIVGCISNTIHSHAQFNKKQGLFEYFDPCILSNEVKIRKPDSNIFDLYLKQVNCKAEEALFITEIDPQLSGANNAGLKTLQFFNPDRLEVDLISMKIVL